MKLTTVLLFGFCLSVGVKGFSQRVSLSENNTSLVKVFKKISRQTNYTFVYTESLLKKSKKVSIVVKDELIEDALAICFKDQSLAYTIFEKMVVIKEKDLIPSKEIVNDPPPGLVISGKILNRNSEVLVAATINEKGTSNATEADANGNFIIKVTSDKSILIFSHVGYVPLEVVVGNQYSFSVKLTLINLSLSDLVIIGYGSRKQRDVTGAISTVSSKDIQISTSMTPELALQGRAPGVFVESGGGDPGARPIIRIRGVNTFGYAEPLYVIDGVPVFEGGAGIIGGAIGDIRSPINIFTMLNPADIESMTVLKDASAAAIYGVRASNGVILITTKKGKSGKPIVEFNGIYGTQKIATTINTLNTQQYFTLLEESYNNYPDANTTFAQKFGPLYDVANPKYVGNGPTYNWQNELRNNHATLQDYNVKVSGGNDQTTYFFSTGYSKTESPLKSNELERYSVAVNVDSKITKYLQAGINIRLINQNALQNTQSDLNTMMLTIPFQPFYDNNDKSGFALVSTGTFKANPAYDPSKLIPGAPFVFDQPQSFLWGTQTRYNVFAFQQLNSNRYNLLNTLGNAFIQIEPVKGLKIKGSLGGSYMTNLRKNFTAFDAWRFSQTPGNPYESQDGNAKGSYGERLGTTININKELTLNYEFTFRKNHAVDLILGASDQYSKWSWANLSGNVNYTNPQYWSIVNQPPYAQAQGGILQEDALLGYLGRVSYKFRDKYYFDATIRRDGSSRLAPGNKFDNFPSFAAAWRISSENFFRRSRFINDLKLRGGWGKLGNFQSAGPYQYISNISLTPDYSLGSGNGNNGGTQTQGAYMPNFANPSLTWEKVKTGSVGLDAVLFNNLVTFTAEYYSKSTYDIIQSVALPPNTGIQEPADLNVATVKNSGIELQLGYKKRLNKINFNASANITTVKNRVQKLNGGAPIGGEGGRVEQGYSMFYLWGYKVGGIFQNKAEIDDWKKRNSKGDALIGANQYKPGDMYFQDIHGAPGSNDERFSPGPDSVVNEHDRTYLGKRIAGFYYGLNLEAAYRGFDITAFFQGVGDVQKYNYIRAGLESMSTPANQWATTFNRWTTNKPSATMPRAVFSDPYAANRFSSRYVENASYLRLRTLQIGYTLSKKVMGKVTFGQRLRFYVSGINLFTITKYTGLDPENDILPPTRQLIFGVMASF